jgi:hypothetical protein
MAGSLTPFPSLSSAPGLTHDWGSLRSNSELADSLHLVSSVVGNDAPSRPSWHVPVRAHTSEFVPTTPITPPLEEVGTTPSAPIGFPRPPAMFAQEKGVTGPGGDFYFEGAT